MHDNLTADKAQDIATGERAAKASSTNRDFTIFCIGFCVCAVVVAMFWFFGVS